MKLKINAIKLSLAALVLAFPCVSNANVWAPTNEDSNFFTLEALMGLPSGDTFGIFEDSADIQNGAAPLLSFVSGSTLSFVQNGNHYDIGNGVSNAVLMGSNHFQIAWLAPDQSWMAETARVANTLIGENVWQLVFDPNSNVSGDEHRLFAVDVTPSLALSDGPAAVPVPGAIWLFASGFTGMVGLRNRKNRLG